MPCLYLVCAGAPKNYNFESSAKDVTHITQELQDYLLTESVDQFKKVLEEPRFFEGHNAYCHAFGRSREKGILTRVHEGDPPLVGSNSDKFGWDDETNDAL